MTHVCGRLHLLSKAAVEQLLDDQMFELLLKPRRKIECLRRSAVIQERIDEVYASLNKKKLPFGAHVGEPQPLERYAFRDDPKESKVFWDVRKGLIPIVGGGREPGALPGLTVSSALPLSYLLMRAPARPSIQ